MNLLGVRPGRLPAPVSGGWSELLVLGQRTAVVSEVVVVVAVVVRDRAGVEPGRAVLERQTHADELGLDLVDRLGTEVADVEQVRLAAAHELAHRVDALALEAVVRPDGEV